MIVEDKNARVRACNLAIEVRGREAADAAAHDDEVVGFARVLRRAGCVPEGTVAQGVRGIERAGMATAQSRERGGIVVRRLLRIAVACGEQMPGHEGSACGHRHAVKEVAARDVALHSQFTVASVAQRASESAECSHRNIVLSVPTGTFCTYILKAI